MLAKSEESLTSDGRCPLCSQNARQRLRLRHTGVMSCPNPDCGLMFAFPQLDDQALEAAYRKHYYPHPQTGVPEYENTPEQFLRQVFDRANTQLAPLAGKSLLDFGCGVGRLCRVARNYGMRTVGIEVDANARDMASRDERLEVFADVKTLKAAQAGTKFDVITMWDVVEHLRQPWRELAELSELLAPGGWLLLSTPNANCLRAVLERGRWINMVNPTHFYYFTGKSLKAALSRAGLSRASQWAVPLRYAGHSVVRQVVHKGLLLCRLQGQMLFVARPG
jgi:2-polyprenyl-3-methyl-5-hydroxy-6-metoxy-1,4-benzoquinol methylase